MPRDSRSRRLAPGPPTCSGASPALAKQAEGADARRARFLAAQLTAAATRLRMLKGEKSAVRGRSGRPVRCSPGAEAAGQLRPGARQDRGAGARARAAGRPRRGLPAALHHSDRPAQAGVRGGDCRVPRPDRRATSPCPRKKGSTWRSSRDKSWSGYNYYQGDYHSRIEINTDLPIRICARASTLAATRATPATTCSTFCSSRSWCKERGWIEFSVYPLYSPQSLIAEGSANYGIELAFPGPERTRLGGEGALSAGRPAGRRGRPLRPAPGRHPRAAGRALHHSPRTARGADRRRRGDCAEPALPAGQPGTRPPAVAFTHQYRSYVINYGLGLDMVRADVEAAGSTPDARWGRMKRCSASRRCRATSRAGARASRSAPARS